MLLIKLLRWVLGLVWPFGSGAVGRNGWTGDKMSLVRAVASLELHPSADVKNKRQGWD